jgi:hypothetical protein
MGIKFNHNFNNVEILFSYEDLSREDLLFEGINIDEEDCIRRCTYSVILIDNKEVASGSSICRPPDNFSRSIGRKIALQNALEGVPDKNFRTIIWKKYRENCK